MAASGVVRIWARRALVAVMLWAVPGTLFGLTFYKSGLLAALFRTSMLAVAAASAFTVFERWPRQTPRWLPRWLLQVTGIALAIPSTMFLIYLAWTPAGGPAFWLVSDRLIGFLVFSIVGTVLSVAVCLVALVWQRDASAKRHRLALELKASELERDSLRSRLGLLQAQVAPHFLYNTLESVQALVDAGSPKAAEVLDSLMTYLQHSVPRLDESSSTVGNEIALVTAYLDVMATRMPDRLTFAVHVEDDAKELRIPALTMLCLVENAVRHGIDPSPSGGRISIEVGRRAGRCVVRISDTGVGLNTALPGVGTGLASLRERLELFFNGDGRLTIFEAASGGVVAVVDVPAVE